MEAVTGWAMGIIGVVLLGVLVDLIIPEGKTQKYIRSVFGVITVFVIILPLPSLVKKDYTLNLGQNAAGRPAVALDETYLYGIYRDKVTAIERGTEKYLTDNGYGGTSVTVTVDAYVENPRILQVSVNVENAVIAADKRHINKYETVRDLTAKYVNVERGVVTVYG